ncbi:MAG: YopX family protein [Treponema sp.]|jgi:uncharacterized phage protein (TIGR01671 family)|nr:YopX family protein [Treponema sp.]
MKEHLFRGKEIKTGKWVYGGFHEHKPSIAAIGKRLETEALIIADGNADWDLPVPIKAYVVEKESVGLYSGLEDKNGAKIFEGDIVEIKFDNTDDPRLATFLGELRRGVIEYRKGGFGAKTINLSNNNYEFEVIGNKSDNPELLKEAGLE